MHELRALVVDDSKVGRVTMMKKLEAMNVKVDLAESGQIALDYLTHQQPDVIFMDHMMPDMDGFETTRRIKAAPATRHIPVIIVSGNDEADFIEAARAAGANDAIDKPPANEVLAALLASLPKRVAAAVATPVQPVAVAPTPAPPLDMAEVHILLARLVTEGMAPLREAVMAELGRRLASESASLRKTLQESADRLELQVTAMADLQRAEAATEATAESLVNRVQSLEQRIQPLEAEAARPQPDLAALQAEIGQNVEHRMEQRIANGLAESQARNEALTLQLENLRQGLQDLRGIQDERTTQAEQRVAMMDSRLNMFGEDLERISRDVKALAVAQPEPGESGQQLSETRVRELVAEALKQSQPFPRAPVTEVPVAPVAPPTTVTANPQTEIAELRARLKTLTTLTTLGGALLLAAIGGLLIWG